ncbi:MmgE/PrpD family protein [Halorubrum amylolyticum]|uniref:MmgE/PrpD family protein n=1 Tax=Halorubrum amylolyticum TaxID=2508724 RepID=UPI001008F54E
MTTTGELATFLNEVQYDELPDDVIDATKKRLLDSVGIALGAVGEPATDAVLETVRAEGGDECSLWARSARTSLSGAAFHNTALVRYLDFMDSFLAPGETPHPSDNVGVALAAAEHADATGEELLAAVAAAYELQGELAWNAPVRDRGWDHVTHTVITQAAAAAKLLGLDHKETRNALGIAGTAHNALRVTRTGGINEWKGLASGNAARNGAYAARLAANGIEGPTNLFEGQKGWKDVVAGEFTVDLDPECSRLHDVMCKRYVAETYAQSAVEGIIELADFHDIDHEAVESIHLDTFGGAKLIIGGGEGDRHEVETKAQADHSLPYMLAAALVDRRLQTEQYEPDRIRSDDVQTLLRTVTVEEDEELTDRFEAGEMPARIAVTTEGGSTDTVEKDDFRGHPNNPMDWEDLETKFHAVVPDDVDRSRRVDIIESIKRIDDRSVDELLTLLTDFENVGTA